MLKKLLKGVVAVLLALLAIVVVGGFLMDGKIELDTEQRLKTPPAALMPLLSTKTGLERWIAEWMKGETTPMVMKKKGGPDEGVGLSISFESPAGDVFETWTIREVTPTRVVYDVDFAGMMTTTRIITLTPGSFEGCDAHWNEVAEISNPVFRWMKLMMDMNEVIENRNKALRALDAAA